MPHLRSDIRASAKVARIAADADVRMTSQGRTQQSVPRGYFGRRAPDLGSATKANARTIINDTEYLKRSINSFLLLSIEYYR